MIAQLGRIPPIIDRNNKTQYDSPEKPTTSFLFFFLVYRPPSLTPNHLSKTKISQSGASLFSMHLCRMQRRTEQQGNGLFILPPFPRQCSDLDVRGKEERPPFSISSFSLSFPPSYLQGPPFERTWKSSFGEEFACGLAASVAAPRLEPSRCTLKGHKELGVHFHLPFLSSQCIPRHGY